MNKPFRKHLFFSLSLIVLLFNSCIENDCECPIVPGIITSFRVSGQVGNSEINNDQRIVTAIVSDTVSIDDITIIEFLTNPSDATITPDYNTVHDFTDTVIFTLSTYQDYDWKIAIMTEIQEGEIIEFEIENQVGESTINAENKTVLAYVQEGSDLQNINIITLEVSEGSTYTPNKSEVHDFTTPQVFTVTNQEGIDTEWTVTVEEERGLILNLEVENQVGETVIYSDENVNIVDFTIPIDQSKSEVNVISVELSPGSSISPDITTVTDFSTPQDFVVTTPGGTNYNWTVRAQHALQVPFSNFNTWFSAGRYILPGEDDTTPWISSDKGATAIIGGTTTVEMIERSPGDFYAQMTTKRIVGVLAASSLFTGDLDITNPFEPVPEFGKPYGEARPRKVKFDFMYSPASDPSFTDQCDIYVLLQVKDENSGDIYRLGTMWFRNSATINEWQTIEMDLIYGELPESAPDYSKVRPDSPLKESGYYSMPYAYPNQISVVAASSYDGDNFNGNVGSQLSLDNLELIY